MSSPRVGGNRPAEWEGWQPGGPWLPDRPGAVFIADSTTMRETGHPLLAVSTDWDGEPFAEDEEEFVTQFRLAPNAAVEISTNLGLGNMDFEDFAGDGLHERWA
jgi:Domain of unknown function (DUF6924)